MAQEIQKIATAKERRSVDIGFIPMKSPTFHMRVGDERCLVDSYEFEVLAAVISHLKFVAGMDVGEKRRSQAGALAIISMGKGVFSAFVYRRRLSGIELGHSSQR